MTAPSFLEGGAASMASMFLMSHHGFRRDLALFGHALRDPARRTPALAAEWTALHAALHMHHQAEDGSMFPGMRAQHAHLGPVIDRLSSDHARIDPLLERADAAFARLDGDGGAAAGALVAELSELLSVHLAVEEAEIVPLLRAIPRFEAPPLDEAMVAAMAVGFAWSAQGVAPEVLERVFAMLPAPVLARLPAARDAYASRFANAFGPVRVRASLTAEPEGISD